MEFLPNGYTLEVPEAAFPLSTDSMVLSHFARLPRNARVLDLGSGCGTLGLLLCSRREDCTVTGLEIDETAHEAALVNIRRNNLQCRMESICADLRGVSQWIPAGSCGCCISNPPYFSGGPASRTHTAARREDTCTAEDLFAAADWALKFGGDFFLVHKPEKLAQLIALGAKHNLEAKRLCLVRHRADAPVNLILLQFRKCANPGLNWEEIVLRNADGSPTDIYKEIYHIKEA